MKQLVLAGVMALVPAGCRGGSGLDAAQSTELGL